MRPLPQLGDSRALPDGGSQVFDGRAWVEAEGPAGRLAARTARVAKPRGLADLAFTADELAGVEVPARIWHVKGMIPARAVTLFQGDGGTGKSQCALQLCASTVLGRTWLGQEVRQGRALYLSAEDDQDEIHRRLDAIAVDLGVQLDALSGLKVLDVTGEDAVLAIADRAGVLSMTDRWRELEQVVAAWRPALIALDNLADVYAGDENSRPQVRHFVSRLQGCAAHAQAALILIGHPSLAGIASGTGSSGSTAWNNSVRSRLYLTRPTGEEAETQGPNARLLTVKKANYAPANLELRLQWRGGVFQADADLEAGISALEAQVGQNRTDQLFLELLGRYTVEGRKVTHTAGHGYAPALFARDHQAKGITKGALAAAMNRLFEAKQIRVVTEGPPSRQTRHLAATD